MIRVQTPMALMPGTRLGPYEIVALIGAGGMGEVYRARDSKLKRDVAIKVLPEAFANDPERLARFTREAQVLATLNHPNIATIYGVEDAAGVPALVLELVEGPTLADRIAAAPAGLTVAEALKVATQMADALEAAHEKGIVHRDLKPANIKLTTDDRVKVLDFGLAKALAEDSAADASASPTLTAMASRLGIIVGTAAYMSPEQAQGKVVGKRADIWAFGCVLFEMLTGRLAFVGETITDTIVAVMTKEPAWEALPPSAPPRIVELLHRCLKKDPRERLRDIGDARFELERIEPVEMPALAGSVPVRGPRPLGTLVASVLSAVVTLGLTVFFLRQPPSTEQISRFELLPPADSTFGELAVSPDGRTIAFTGIDASGTSRLWVRPLGSLAPQPLRDTTGASHPFWSPDGRSIAFFADSKLKRIESSGGSPQTLCALVNDRGGPRGGSWSQAGVILFSVEPFGPEAIYKVAATGGEPEPVTIVDPADHQHWPTFLPDGRHFLYFSASVQRERTGIYLGSVDSKETTLLVRAEASAGYASNPGGLAGDFDYLLFVREQTLTAQPFDSRRLQIVGDAIPLSEQVGVDASAQRSKFSISRTGVLAYQAGGGTTQLVWFDRAGKRLGPLGTPGLYIDFRIAPDGARVAAQREDGAGGADIWIMDPRGTSSRLTLHPSYSAAPVWFPDGGRIAFFSTRNGPWSIYQRLSSAASDDELLMKTTNSLVPHDWSPDGRFLLYSEFDARTPTPQTDLKVLPTSGRSGETVGPIITVVNTEFDENFGRFSGDGRWIVYVSSESGKPEIFARPFHADGSASGDRVPISVGGGAGPRWPRRGNEIFYVSPTDMLMAVPVQIGVTLNAGTPRALFSIRSSAGRYAVLRFDTTADGQRFLVSMPTEDSATAPATIVLNWFEEMKGRTP